MSITIGDRKIPFGGLNSDNDGFDAPPGSFQILSNFIVSRDQSSLISRPPFIQELSEIGDAGITYPTTLKIQSDFSITSDVTGTATDFTFIRPLAQHNYRITSPDSRMIKFLAAMVSFTSDALTAHMLRFYMFPYWNGSEFVEAWKDVTPYYIDIVVNDGILTKSTSPERYKIVPPISEGYINKWDLAGGYVRLEDVSFASGTVAEGDLIISSSSNHFDPNTGAFEVCPETARVGWDGVSMNVIRVFKNLNTGKIPYQQLISSSTGFDGYEFSFANVNDILLVSMKTNNSTKASMTLCLNYINRTWFDGISNENLRTQADSSAILASVRRVFYDSRLVKGLLSNFESADLVGKSVSVDGAFSQTVTAFDPLIGKVTLASGAAATGSTYMWYNNIDISLSVNDFLMSEFDVHGRFGHHYVYDYITPGVPGTLYQSAPFVGFMKAFVKEENDLGKTGVANDSIDLGSEDLTIFGTDASTQKRFLTVCATYNEFRYGLHDLRNHVNTLNAATILGAVPMIPLHFNRNITGISLQITPSPLVPALRDITIGDITGPGGDDIIARARLRPQMQTTSVSGEPTLLDYLSGKTLFQDNLKGSEWSLRLGTVITQAATDLVGPASYVRPWYIGKDNIQNLGFAGNHIAVTGNPDWSKNLDKENDAQVEADLTLSPYDAGSVKANESFMKKDYSFGAKHMILARDRLFMANVQFSEYQYGQIPKTIYNTTDVFFSPSYTVEFGGNYHIYDSPAMKIPCNEIAPITGMAILSEPRGIDQAVRPSKNGIVIFGERGYKIVDLADNNELNWDTHLVISDGCASDKSIVSEEGSVFWLGYNGIYRLDGATRKDISFMGKSSIKNELRNLLATTTYDNIWGVYNRWDNQYMLFIPVVDDGDYVLNVYVFDFNIGEIYTFYAPAYGRIVNLQFIKDNLYLATRDEMVTLDKTPGVNVGDFTTASGSISQTNAAQINPIYVNGKWIRLTEFNLTYSSLNLAFVRFPMDGPIYNYSRTYPITSGMVYDQHKVRAIQGRCRKFAVKISQSIQGLTVYDMDFVVKDVPQKRMMKNEN